MKLTAWGFTYLLLLIICLAAGAAIYSAWAMSPRTAKTNQEGNNSSLAPAVATETRRGPFWGGVTVKVADLQFLLEKFQPGDEVEVLVDSGSKLAGENSSELRDLKLSVVDVRRGLGAVVLEARIR